MTSEETVTLTRKEYDHLIERNSQLEELLAAIHADDGVRVPHEAALDICEGRVPSWRFETTEASLCGSCQRERESPSATSPRLSVDVSQARLRPWLELPMRSAPRSTSW